MAPSLLLLLREVSRALNWGQTRNETALSRVLLLRFRAGVPQKGYLIEAYVESLNVIRKKRIPRIDGGKMLSRRLNRTRAAIVWLTLAALLAMPLSLVAQTRIQYHNNKFSVQDDLKLGRQAAQEAEQQFPLLRDENARAYVERVGQRLVSAIPPEFQHREFQYYFKIINASDINAFALPGGPMYVNRGMIEAARNEGEMAGVMAHELSHVALRHGTAQATKAQKYSTLAGIAGIAGAVLGGPGLGQLAQAPFAVYLLKFSREYETEADVLGAQIMARAGYDPHDLANMFQTIERQSSGGGGFLSDHPSPKDRYARINQEAQLLRVTNPINDSREFAGVQERLRSYPRAPTMAEIQRTAQRYPAERNGGGVSTDRPNGRVDYPSTRFQNYQILNGDVQVSVPNNWRQFDDSNSVWFVPEGAYGQYNGQAVFTHGVNFGVAQTNSRNLQQATNELISNLAQGNGNLRVNGSYQRTTFGGRNAIWTSLINTNEATGRPENVRLIATQLRNGQLLYMIAVAPQNERNFETAFQSVSNSVRIND